MGVLIDSDIIIDFLNNQKPAINLINNSKNQKLFLSVISWAEIVYGFKKNKLFDKKEIFQDLLKDYRISTLLIDEMIAEGYINIKIDLENKRIPLDDFDLLIAATAIANNLTLITRNKKHFKRIKDLVLSK